MNEDLSAIVSSSLTDLFNEYQKFSSELSLSDQLYQSSQKMDDLIRSNPAAFQIAIQILSTLFFKSNAKSEQQLYLILLSHYHYIQIQCHSFANAIFPIEIINAFGTLISDGNFYQADIHFYKFVSSFVGKILDSSQFSLIINIPPNIGILLILKSYIDKMDSIEPFQNPDEIYQYIISNSLFIPREDFLDFSIISASILSFYDLSNDDFYKLAFGLFNTSIIPPLFPLFYELIPMFDVLPDGKDKFSLAFQKLSEIVQFYLISNQFEYNLLHDNETLELGDIAFPFLKYIDYHLSRYDDEEDEEFIEIDKFAIMKTVFAFCIITQQNRSNWDNIDDFFNDCCRNSEDFDENSYVNKSISIILSNLTLSELNELMDLMLKDGTLTEIDPSLFQEAYYRIIFSYLLPDKGYNSFELMAPLKDDDPVLIGEYFRCLHMLHGQLSSEQYESIFGQSNNIINLLLGQGLALSGADYPKELLCFAYEMLSPLVDQFSTEIGSEFCEILGQIILKIGDFIDPIKYLLPLKEKWESCVNNPNLDFNICRIISDFANYLPVIPLLLSLFLPGLAYFLNENPNNSRALEMLSILTQKIPQAELEIGNENEQLLISIYQSSFQSMDTFIELWCEDQSFQLENVHSIAAFYCRIHQINESFGHYLIHSISLLQEHQVTIQKHYFSFLYEFLCLNTPCTIQVIQSILEYLAFVKTQEKGYIKNHFGNCQLFLLSIAAYCTADIETNAKLIIDSIPNFSDVFFPFIFPASDEQNQILFSMTPDEQHIFIILFMSFLKLNPALYSPQVFNVINDVLQQQLSLDNESIYFDEDDPNILSHPFIKLSRNDVRQLLNKTFGVEFAN